MCGECGNESQISWVLGWEVGLAVVTEGVESKRGAGKVSDSMPEYCWEW